MNDSTIRMGMTITALLPDSPAAIAGAKVGDRIIAVDGCPVRDARDFIASTENRGPIFQVEVMRGNQLLSFTFDVSKPAISEEERNNPELIIAKFQAADKEPEPPTRVLN